ncbi:unnamed protein product [Paramecium sonneborni]|uniref:Ubiquitin-like protease family profile domain-containing protein n=1 Tax=Paramecium sonneborni TaxID=65129 RepID=A0A8S1LMJ0_9CILI|nr:unnamed protein product [Paramecium sonneborni]
MLTLNRLEELQETHKILYVSPNNYRKISMINERNSLYGVTVDFKFLSEILTNQFLTSSHLLFYSNLFRQTYKNVKIAVAQCYFFAEYIETSTQQIDNKILDSQLLGNKQDFDEKKNTKNQNLQDEFQNKSIYQQQEQSQQQQTQQQNISEQKLISNNKEWTFQITNITLVQNKQLKNNEKYNVNKLENLLTQMATQNELKDINELKSQDYLYFPINLQNYHWISLVVSLNENLIFYFDSSQPKVDENIKKAVFEILKYIGVKQFQEFKIQTYYNKQENGFDCGIFSLISLLYTYRQQQYDYNQQIVTKYRKYVLYNLAIIGSQMEISKELFERIIQLSLQTQ